MRNTSEESRDAVDWATYAKQARVAAVPPVSQSELARRIGTDRSTIWRWEHGKQRPDTPDIVTRFAVTLELDIEEAHAAAGFRPDLAAREPELDEEVEMVLRADVDDETKRRALEQLHLMRLRDKRRRMEDLGFLLGGRPGNVG